MAQTWLIFEFLLLLRTCRGTQHFTGTVSNEATSEMGYPAWPAGRTCTIFQFRQWRPAKPRTGTSFFGFQLHQDLPQNFDVNRFQSNVRFSQSALLLTSSDGTVAFCKDKERILLQWFSRQVIQFSCQTLGDCLCTPDALHNSNSIRIF